MLRRLLLGSALALSLLMSVPLPPAAFAQRDGRWWKPAPAADDRPSLDGVLGPGADQAWSVKVGEFTVTRDEKLGRDVLTAGAQQLALVSRTSYPAGVEVNALLRMTSPTGNAHSVIALAKRDEKDPAPGSDATKTIARDVTVTLGAARTTQAVNTTVTLDGKPLHDLAELAKTTPWTPQNENAYAFNLKAYLQAMPGWPEDFRQRVEADMATLPGVDEKWLSVRAELRKGLVRVWIEDRLVAWKKHDTINPEGGVQITLSPGVQLAGFRVEPAQATPGFTPIALAGYANAKAFLGQRAVAADALPPAGQIVTVGDVPFEFPGTNLEGNDHIDVGRSLFRQANLSGYIGTEHVPLARWRGSTARDPARIQLRVPNGQYKALHLIAAADGDEGEIPLVSAMFFRPGSGFAQSFEVAVPEALGSRDAQAEALPIRLENGKRAILYLVTIPLDPGLLSSFGDLDIVEIELTKKVHLYRSYPDPISYGYHQGGPASSVHVFAATLERTPIDFGWEPDIFGHTWVSPANPAYTATLTNNTNTAQHGKLTVVTRSFDGTEETRQEKEIQLPAGDPAKPTPVKVAVPVPVKLHGYHDITATLELAGQTWSEKRSLVKLAPDTRSAKWTEGKGALFGYWGYGGGHHTPDNEHHVRLMTLAGARTAIGYPKDMPPEVQALVDKHWSPTQAGAWEVSPQPWAAEEPIDQAKVAEFQKTIIEGFKKWRDGMPEERRPDHVYFYPEPHISSRLTAGNVPAERDPAPYTAEEEQRLKMFFNTSKFAAEAVRRDLPGLRVLIPWGDAGFTWPLLRAGFPNELVDGQGVDTPGFERIPERQLHEQSIHRFYWVNKEWEKYGKKPHYQYNEGIFVPTEPGAVTWREQADIYNRWVLIAMSYGVDRFYSGWFAFDCTNYYGAEHYGGCGIQAKIPYANPKPAYAAYATMTDKLNEANFDGWVETGSLSTYCLRFKKPDGSFVYALWTLRGSRDVSITAEGYGTYKVFDVMNNDVTPPINEMAGGSTIFLRTGPSVTYLVASAPRDPNDKDGPVQKLTLREPDHSDNQPADTAKQIADLGDGSWKLTGRRDEILETNHWGMKHYPGQFSASVVDDDKHGRVLASKLEEKNASDEPILMPFYNVLKPARSIKLAGAPSHLGIWVKGSSDWGRVIYIVRDARGERWHSIGTKDDYNCDDVHSWSQFCFDGWRYLRFELPGHTGYDSFRKHGTTWWGTRGGGAPGSDDIVDLPLTLEEIIVEQRTDVLYVNDAQKPASDTVLLGKLFVEYEKPEDAREDAVKLSRLRMPAPAAPLNLPNPIADMQRDGVGQPTKILKLRPPEHYADGTRVHVDFTEVPGATKYFVWVSPHADGRGAVNMVPAGVTNGQMIYGLRPAMKLYYWIVYADKDGKLSKPSAVHEEVLVDMFKEK